MKIIAVIALLWLSTALATAQTPADAATAGLLAGDAVVCDLRPSYWLQVITNGYRLYAPTVLKNFQAGVALAYGGGLIAAECGMVAASPLLPVLDGFENRMLGGQ
jgi:hypothetical protein